MVTVVLVQILSLTLVIYKVSMSTEKIALEILCIIIIIYNEITVVFLLGMVNWLTKFIIDIILMI